jgi:serine/threonine protein kinase
LLYTQVLHLAIGMFAGLLYLHKTRRAHLDVKTDNILVRMEGAELSAVLADLGECRRVNKEGHFGLDYAM